MCTLCEVPLNIEVELSVYWACCNYCNADSIKAYPRVAIHLGINSDGRHEFALLDKYTCTCGNIIKGIEFYCGDDGCVVDMITSVPFAPELNLGTTL